MFKKPFLTYFVVCAVPLLLLAALNYWNGTRSVGATVNSIVQDDLYSFTTGINQLVDEQGNALLKLAVQREIQKAVTAPSTDEVINLSLEPVLAPGYLKNLTIFDHNHQPIRSDPSAPPPIPDDGVWTSQGNVRLERMVGVGSSKAGLEFAVPIHNENGLGNEGAIVATVDLQRLFGAAARLLKTTSSSEESTMLIVVRDAAGNVVYQSDSPVTQSSGATASAPMPRLNVSIAITRSTGEFLWAARRWGIGGFLLAGLLALGAALFLDQYVRNRSRGIARVTEDLSAIAKGDVDRRILLQSSDDARAIADNINLVTEQLRTQLAREAESRQFDSFVRISAMLTHDLKNAIEGLSLTVSNMERHFDNEQFRIDAMKGLTNATDKLKAIVARLSRPVSSLSGEHKRPTRTDLVPILKRAIAMTAEPVRGQHTIQTNLPDSLYALADAARIEEVVENLLLNAIEAMNGKSGTLRIEAGEDANGAPAFSVSDTGPGMSRAFIENRLFRPFSTTKKNGIGLGLYTCREVIRASGGSIEVQSVEGAGTTFRVVLPSVA
jgi:signal transduction histidine kinase